MCPGDGQVVLLCGIPSETALVMVRSALEDLGAECVVFNQRQVAGVSIELEVRAGRVTGNLTLEDGSTYALESFDGAYLRLMDDRYLPELERQPEGSPARAHSRSVHEILSRWADVASARVVNRPGAMASNASKPYQAQLIGAQGFRIPETLITNDPELVRAFMRRHRDVVYKSLSGVRSIVHRLDEDGLARLSDITWCPVQFQEYIEGLDVRVHTVGEMAFPTAVSSKATDYRYALLEQESAAELSGIEISANLTDQCVDLSRSLGLDFAGIDLKVTPEGEVYCFEVNPSPAFSYYEAWTGQPIADAVARHLAGYGFDSGHGTGPGHSELSRSEPSRAESGLWEGRVSNRIRMATSQVRFETC